MALWDTEWSLYRWLKRPAPIGDNMSGKRKKRAKIDHGQIRSLAVAHIRAHWSHIGTKIEKPQLDAMREGILKSYKSPKGYGKPNVASLKKVIKEVVGSEYRKYKRNAISSRGLNQAPWKVSHPQRVPPYQTAHNEYNPPKAIPKREGGMDIKGLQMRVDHDLMAKEARLSALKAEMGRLEVDIRELTLKANTIEAHLNDPTTLQILGWLNDE